MKTKAEIIANYKSGPKPDFRYLAQNGFKKCKGCQETKSTNAFFTSSRSFDLLNPKCRQCSNNLQRKHRLPGYNSESCKRYNAKNKEKRSAHRKVQHALRKMILTKQPCLICGNLKSEAHHEDYSQPLEVIWFCRAHHAAHHEAKRKVETFLQQ